MSCSRSTTAPSTLISKIAFVGNHAFSEGRLSEVINSREERWWRFLSTSDQYDPERLNFDKELLRRFYLKNGYADFQIRDAKCGTVARPLGVFPDLHGSARASATVSARSTSTSQLRNLTGDDLRGDLQFDAGDWYDGDAVGRTVDAMEQDVHNRGYAFVEVKPLRQPRPREAYRRTWPSMSARGRASMSSGSTSSATRAPRTR